MYNVVQNKQGSGRFGHVSCCMYKECGHAASKNCKLSAYSWTTVQVPM